MSLKRAGEADDSKPPEIVERLSSDATFKRNYKVIADLLTDEQIYYCVPTYCPFHGEEHRKWMRRLLIKWVREICHFRKSDCGVLAHAIQLVDRYVKVAGADKSRYQLIGTACYLVASKLKDVTPADLEDLVRFTDNSVSEDDILNMEVSVCLSLNWDLCCITPVDYFYPVIEFLTLPDKCRDAVRRIVVESYWNILHVDDIGFFTPRYIAAACIIRVISLLKLDQHATVTTAELIDELQKVLQLNYLLISQAYQLVDSLFIPRTSKITHEVDNMYRQPIDDSDDKDFDVVREVISKVVSLSSESSPEEDVYVSGLRYLPPPVDIESSVENSSTEQLSSQTSCNQEPVLPPPGASLGVRSNSISATSTTSPPSEPDSLFSESAPGAVHFDRRRAYSVTNFRSRVPEKSS